MRLRRRSRVVLITGASGFLGQHVVRRAEIDRMQIIAPSSHALDITDEARTIDTITSWRPDAVLHLAYRKGDRRTIVDGSRHVAMAARAARARLVHVSSDAVFAGRHRAYTEADLPDPITPYGLDKREAEIEVASIDPRAAVVRTSLLYGTERPSSFQREVVDDLHADRRRMRLYTDEFRCPAHADDLAASLLHLIRGSDVCGAINIAGPERVSRVDFARACARYAGFDDPDFRTTTIAESGERRPGDVALDSSAAAGLGLGCRPLIETLG